MHPFKILVPKNRLQMILFKDSNRIIFK